MPESPAEETPREGGRDAQDSHRSDPPRQEEALRDSEARLSAIFARAAVGLSEADLSGGFLRVNDEMCRLLGRTREEILSLSMADVTHPGDLPATIAAIGLVAASGMPASLDKRYLRPDGTTIWANSAVTLLSDEKGAPLSLLGVTVDLTQRKQLEDELRRSNETLEARVRERTAAYRDLTRRMVRAQEEERQRISRDLHDSTGQYMAALSLELASMERAAALTRAAAAEAAQVAADAARLALEAAQAAREAAAKAAVIEVPALAVPAGREAFAAARASAIAGMDAASAANGAASANAAVAVVDDSAPHMGRLRSVLASLSRDIHSLAVTLRPTSLDDLGLVPALTPTAKNGRSVWVWPPVSWRRAWGHGAFPKRWKPSCTGWCRRR
jgi:PAS domain S-box-containing protein